MTESDLQAKVFYSYNAGCSCLINNYTPSSWFECDMMGITKAGYMREWEIKLTKSDFKADRKKHRSWITNKEGRCVRDSQTKYNLLESGSEEGPCQFWYVVPEGLIIESDLPAFAGLLYVNEPYYQLREIVKAPRLHTCRVAQRVLTHLRAIFYYRYWNLKQTMLREKIGINLYGDIE